MRFLVCPIIVALSLSACNRPNNASNNTPDGENVASAEAFVDAFYSFDASRLEAILSSAEESAPAIVFYQGWAKGGNYRVVNRMPCVSNSVTEVNCSITVKDDLMRALDINFDVTDTFHLTFADGMIVAVETSSNDLPVFRDAMEWVKGERAELIQEPCRGYFAGGLTPGECVSAMVRGFAEFAAGNAPTIDQSRLDVFASGYAAAWSSQNPDDLASFYAEDGRLIVNAGTPSVGREAIAATAGGYMTGFPDMVVRMDSVIGDGSQARFHWTWTGTNTGPGGTGRSVRLSGYEAWTIDSDGLILESQGHFDEAEYQLQVSGDSGGS